MKQNSESFIIIGLKIRHLLKFEVREMPQNNDMNHVLAVWLQLVIPKVRYSEGLVNPKVRYSEGPLFRRFVNPKMK